MADQLISPRGGIRPLARGGRAHPMRPAVRAWGAAALVVNAALATTLVWRPRPLLLWNASPSSPVGLYAVDPWARPGVGEMAIARMPAPARPVAAARSYLPAAVPLVKWIAAGAGDRVCARGGRILVNDRMVALRRSRDPSGRPMPWWSGCRRLQHGELLLLNPAVSESFDGRYFGPSNESDVLGRARLLWRR